jgi:TPP-dependent pyruvate/acetoin dehydrogenase alpha subunit
MSAAPMTQPFDLEAAYGWMSLARVMEERLRSAYTQGRLRGRFLSGRGQEAIPAGAAMCLEPDDYLAPVHRDLAAHLVRGTTPATIFRHYLGRATGPSCGRDGDLHMGEWSRRIFPMVSHLPDSWPVMTGVALKCKLRGEPNIAMAFCGDGATSTGAWHEAVNFAAVQRLPIVFVVEDNQYAYSTPREAQFACRDLVDRAVGYGIPGYEVDGNDVDAVNSVVSKAVRTARTGDGPTLVVATTMRMEGHAFHDAAAYVPEELTAEWATRDPLLRAEDSLRALGWDDARLTAVREEQVASVRQAWADAEADPLPEGSDVERGVYAT